MKGHRPRPKRVPLRIFIAGVGPRWNIEGSGYAYENESTDEGACKYEEGLSAKEAEYKALIQVLEQLAEGAHARIFTDSESLVQEFKSPYNIGDSQVRRLRSHALDIVQHSLIHVTVEWVPREVNPAGQYFANYVDSFGTASSPDGANENETDERDW
jgi:ribonuclease HI